MKIAVVLGSIRKGRKGEAVASWIMDQVKDRDDATYELLDVASFDIPLLTEPTVPGAANREYETPQTREWSKAIDEFDGYVWVSPEYNHGVPGALKNAFDVIYPEWGNKAAAMVGYGADGAVRATEHWRTIFANAHLCAVRGQLSLSTMTEWDGDTFTPNERRPKELDGVLTQLVTLAGALAPLRGKKD